MATIEATPADHLDLGVHNHHATGLRRDALNFTETLAQSIANIAPTLTPAVNLQLVYASSGNGTWFTYLLATIGLLFIGVCIKHFASKTSTPGALYSYVSMSLGPTAGFITGWALILAYVTTGIAVASYTVPYFQTLLGSIHIPSLILFVVVVGLVWLIAFKDVRLSAKMMLTMEGLSVGLILILGMLVVAHTGLHLGPQLALKGMTLNGLQNGMVLGVFSFVGFESATALGAEAKNPRVSIPRAVFLSTALAGTFFMLMSFVMVSAFSGYKTHLDDPNLVALPALADIARVPALGILLSAGAVVSLFACSLACVTAASRVLLSMSRDGLIHAQFGKAHDTNATPHVCCHCLGGDHAARPVRPDPEGLRASGHLQHERHDLHLRLPGGLRPDRCRVGRLRRAREGRHALAGNVCRGRHPAHGHRHQGQRFPVADRAR